MSAALASVSTRPSAGLHTYVNLNTRRHRIGILSGAPDYNTRHRSSVYLVTRRNWISSNTANKWDDFETDSYFVRSSTPANFISNSRYIVYWQIDRLIRNTACGGASWSDRFEGGKNREKTLFLIDSRRRLSTGSAVCTPKTYEMTPRELFLFFFFASSSIDLFRICTTIVRELKITRRSRLKTASPRITWYNGVVPLLGTYTTKEDEKHPGHLNPGEFVSFGSSNQYYAKVFEAIKNYVWKANRRVAYVVFITLRDYYTTEPLFWTTFQTIGARVQQMSAFGPWNSASPTYWHAFEKQRHQNDLVYWFFGATKVYQAAERRQSILQSCGMVLGRKHYNQTRQLEGRLNQVN